MATIVDWWLGELDQHGNPELIDGPHADVPGVEQALWLIENLGMRRGRNLVGLRIEQFEVKPVAHNVNHEATAACRTILENQKGK